MTYGALIIAYRKPGTTHAEFKDHWENKHVPLVKAITGPFFPLTSTRHYIHRTAGSGGGSANPNHPATLFTGSQDAVDYDGVAELTFESEEAFKAFVGVISEPEAAARIAEDEETFLDRGKLAVVMLGETIVTRRDKFLFEHLSG